MVKIQPQTVKQAARAKNEKADQEVRAQLLKKMTPRTLYFMSRYDFDILNSAQQFLAAKLNAVLENARYGREQSGLVLVCDQELYDWFWAECALKAIRYINQKSLCADWEVKEEIEDNEESIKFTAYHINGYPISSLKLFVGK